VTIATVNPATGETLKTYSAASPAEIEAALEASATAYRRYRATTFAQRGAWLEKAADLLDERREELAAIVTMEMGKTLVSARAEVAKCAVGARFYAERAEEFLADQHVPGDLVGATKAFTRWQPLGAVLAVMPWNYPLWQVMRFAAPTLMAGNTCLLKHASNVPQCALALETIFAEAGFPTGVFQTLLIESGQVAGIIEDPRVVAVTLTGSEGAGRAVGAAAGGAIKKVLLELGGNDAFLVMPSADLERAASVGVLSRCQNNGQSCVAAKRFLVHESIAAEFRDLLIAKMSALSVGDPAAEGTDVGPLATESGRADVERQVADAVSAGATLLLGGHRVVGDGWFYEPTVITDITTDMQIRDEEVFGPVVQLYTVPDLDAAIELANASHLGLSASAWTNDVAEQARVINEFECGAVFINGMSVSYPELPFGGIKDSGHGRELAAMGIREFSNAKTVWVRTQA
jgi:succinate-semialdehyde dehydrogenase/glutarate-semialdehyde dehydrogenase